ncbi:MAG: VOC family protein [Longimicrobiales bacterium]|nr:VOC family protein [Longimicrobiales bacterium]
MTAPALSTRGFHHITMVSTDAGRTLAFYRELLGVDLVKKTVNFDDPSAYHLYFGDEGGRPGTILTFFEWPHAGRGRWGVGGIHHLALGVATAEAQLKWKRRLTDAGVPVSGPLDRGYFRSLYFADPDGQILEIATRGPGYAIDEPADALGRELLVPPVERLPGGRDEEAIAVAMHPEPVPAVTEDMRLEGIHHITGITNDIERSDAFYQAALGLKLVKKTYNQDDAKTLHYFWADYDGHTVGAHSALTLFDWPGSNHFARPGAGQTHHIAFRARDDEEQAAWRDHLLALGLDVSPVMERNYFRSIYFRAPDGLLLEIATDGPGFAVDERAGSLGSALKLPPWLEPQRSEIEGTLIPLGY